MINLSKTVLKLLYKTNALEFKTWKDPLHFEQYSSISFLGKEIKRIKWTELEKLDRKK